MIKLSIFHSNYDGGIAVIRIAICDDLYNERNMIKSLLTSIQNEEQKWEFNITQYEEGEALLMDMEENLSEFDLVILDIYMDGINGMETARKIRENDINIPIVFLTASPDFALESYDVNAFGYLLKPVKKDKLKDVLYRLLKHYVRPRVCIQCERRKRYLFLDEIVYIESQNHNVYIHLSDGDVLTSREKLSNLENMLDQRFLRCHQSFLVNMRYIADVEEDFILKDGTIVPIRIRQRKAIADEYYRFFCKERV